MEEHVKIFELERAAAFNLPTCRVQSVSATLSEPLEFALEILFVVGEGIHYRAIIPAGQVSGSGQKTEYPQPGRVYGLQKCYALAKKVAVWEQLSVPPITVSVLYERSASR